MKRKAEALAYRSKVPVTTRAGNCVLRRTRPVGRNVRIHFALKCGRDTVGDLTVIRARDANAVKYQQAYGLPPTTKVYWIAEVDVDVDQQRKGIATKLYEAAGAYACARGGVLVSNTRLADAKSNDFWLKQVKKGRAVALPGPEGGEFYERPVVLDCRKVDDLSGLPRRKKRRK